MWASLLILFSKVQGAEADSGVLRVGGPESSKFEKRELRIAEICIDKGVMISPGTNYKSTEYGWFRVTFTVDKAMLKEGLQRIWRALQDPEVTGWE